jgi:drug/metabolite transporter (DMT)-like permease
MLAGCFSFALMGELAHLLGPTCDWRLVALARSSLVLLIALAVAGAAGTRLVFLRPRVLWLRSLAGSVSLVCTFYALAQLRPSEVLTLTNTFPIWVAVLSWPLLRERPGTAVWLSAGCGVVGIILIQRPHFAAGNVAIPLALIAAFSSAVAMLGLHRLGDLDAWAIVVHFSAVATLIVLAVILGATAAGAAPPPWGQVLTGRNFLLLLGVAVTATAGQLFLTRAFTAGSPAKVSVVGLTQVVFALGLDLLLDGSAFSPSTLAGIGLVLAPTAWMMAGRASE